MELIAAIATPVQRCAIGILRLSGDGALSFAGQVFRPRNGRPLEEARGHSLVYGGLYDREGVLLDHCLAAVFRAPHSYTGEDAVEFQCHGSPVVLTRALETLFSLGARQAGPGEFTRRAFLNGRLDLTQAEAVIDLIDAETEAAAKSAAGQLDGTLHREVEGICDALLDTEAHFQALVDYPDEDLDPLELPELRGVLASAGDRLYALEDTYPRGRLLREGVSCVLAGRPNVGKSSLLNALLGWDRAIVTELPGTTRDTVTESLVLGGLCLHLTDTAGVRETGDRVEQLGVERALREVDRAELVLCVLDASAPLADEDRALLHRLRGRRTVLLLNKWDLPRVLRPEDLGDWPHVLPVSARDGTGLSELDRLVGELFGGAAPAAPGTLLTNLRHLEAVRTARKALRRALEALDGGLTPDVVLLDVEDALSALGELTGRQVRESVLARIFDRFCVGK